MAVIGGETSGRDHAVDVRMQQKILAPGVENADNADLRAEVLGIGGDLQRGRGTRSKQQIVIAPGIVLRQHVEFVRHGEDDMKVAGRQELSLLRGKPAFARLRLALGAVPVAARVIRDGLMTASGASIEMTTERRGAAVPDGTMSLELLKVVTGSIPVQEAISLRAEDISHLHGGSCHGCFLR